MSNLVFNIAKGRVKELYNRVKSNDPTNSAFILVPLETTGLAADATMIDYADLSTLLAGATNEQTTMGRKTLTDTELASLSAPDNTNDRNECDLPTVTWAAATGNAISKILVCYDSDTTGGTDTNIIPLFQFDFAMTPDGSDIVMTGGTAYRAS